MNGKNRRSGNWRIVSLMVLVLCVMTSCAPAAQTSVHVEGQDYQVQRTKSAASATWKAAKALDTLDNNQLHPLLPQTGGGWVDTNAQGVARLTGQNCTEVFVYRNSTLKIESCYPGAPANACTMGTVSIKNCDLKVQTLSADIETVGTWYTVTYLAELELTLITVIEGEIVVTPVTHLEYTEPDAMQFVVTRREMGDLQTVSAGTDGVFVYTAPLESLERLQLQLPPLQVAPLSDLPDFADTLTDVAIQNDIPIDPFFGWWMLDIQNIVRENGFSFPEMPDAPEISLIEIVPPDTTSLSGATVNLLPGVDTQPGASVIIGMDLPGQRVVDLRQPQRIPQYAQDAVAGFSRLNNAQLLYLPGQEAQVDFIAAQLRDINFQLQPLLIQPDEMRSLLEGSQVIDNSIRFIDVEGFENP